MSSRGIEFAAPAAQCLMEEGRFDPRWVSAFLTHTMTVRHDPDVWEPEYFRLQHFVVSYLPLRYWAWTRLAHARNPETEATLGMLILTVSETLWREACDTETGPDGSELARLVLGSGNPLRMSASALLVWQERFSSMLSNVSDPWKRLTTWPRWDAMALHFASFYLPFALAAERPPAIEGQSALLSDLAFKVDQEVLSVIRNWLLAAEAERNEAGIPVPNANAARGATLIERTRIEVLLMG
jgi:hypothetical protein